MIPELEAVYAKPGYEWRVILLESSSSTSSINTTDPYEVQKAIYDYTYTRGIDIDESHYIPDGWEFLWEDLSDRTEHVASFTLRQDGVDYPGCQIFYEYAGGINDVRMDNWAAYVPENFDGELAVYYVGQKFENGKSVKDESSPIIIFRF